MKICWNNLENLIYRRDKKEWEYKNNNIFYIYKDSCKKCNKPFLSKKYNENFYCDYFCSNSKKHLSEIHKRKISESLKGKKRSYKSNWKGGYYSNNIPTYNQYNNKISYAERVRRNKKDSNVLEVKCAYCGKWHTPTLNSMWSRITALNGIHTSGENRFYCSDNCKQECPIYNRVKYSAEENNTKRYSREVQPELRQLVFDRDNYTCQKCEKHQDDLDCGLHCHHFEGIEINPIESADIDKCITLCKDCHKEVHKNPCPIKDYRRKNCK